MTYKWNTPYEWFENYVQTMDRGELHTLLLEFASEVDFDTIQSKFGAMMDDDGYFENEEEKESSSPTPYEQGRKHAYDDRDKGIWGVPYSACPFRESDERWADWAYGYLDQKGHYEYEENEQ